MTSSVPAPGVDHDPVMTWGLIEGTPFRLDATDTVAQTPSTGPVFNMPAPTNRDKLQEKMFNEMNRKKRALSAASRGGTPAERRKAKRAKTPGMLTPAARFAAMSPAAQRLGKSLARGSSVLLRNAYSSPFAAGRAGSVGGKGLSSGTGRTPMAFSSGTPGSTPRTSGSRHRRTAAGGTRGSGAVGGSRTPRQKPTLPPGVSVTDNLL